MALVTLSEIKDQARQRADMVNSKFFTEAELNNYVNQSVKELYDRLINAGEFYYMQDYTVPVLVGSDTYSLPPYFYKLLGVDLVLDSNGNAVTLRPFQFEQRNAYLFTPTWNIVGLSYLRYMVQGDTIKFVPKPSSPQNIRIWYAPMTPKLVDTPDPYVAPAAGEAYSFQGINGWEEYVIVDMCIKMLMKEESDPSAFMAQKQAMIQRIEEMKVMRDIGATGKIADVSRIMPWEFWSFNSMS